MMMILPVRDFGQVYLYADNGGALYPPSIMGKLLLNYEFARSRAAFVRRYVKAAQAEGVVFSTGVTERLERGEAALAKASDAGEPAARAGHSNDSLADTMWAGEMAAVERARHHIARNGPRPGFLFGCNAFGYAKSDEYARLYRDLLNYGTVPFYRASTEKVEGHPDYSAVDAILEELAGTGILPKGHPLVWFHRAGIPEFLKTKSWAEIKQSCREYILRSVGHFRSRIHTWDVINEAHDLANELGFDQQQLLDLTRLAVDTTRLADPTAFRVVNSCCTWGEYAAEGKGYNGEMRQPIRTPLQYYKALEDARVSYDAVGLQLYYPDATCSKLSVKWSGSSSSGKPSMSRNSGCHPRTGTRQAWALSTRGMARRGASKCKRIGWSSFTPSATASRRYRRLHGGISPILLSFKMVASLMKSFSPSSPMIASSA